MKMTTKKPGNRVAESARVAYRGGRKREAGIVDFCVYGHSGVGDRFSSLELIETIKVGLPVQELDELRHLLDLTMDRLIPILGLSKATFHRRKIAGKLDEAESDRLVRFARLLGTAVEVMESLENARRWLSSPQIGLGGAIPLEFAGTEVGAREVEDLLGRIDYSVYS